MGFFSRHRKAFRSVIASFGMLFGLLAGCATNPVVEQEKEPENAQVMPFSNGPLNLGIEGLSASYSGDGSFSWSNNVISGNVECSMTSVGSTKTANLSLTNTSGKKAVFGFKTYCSRIEGSANAWGTSLNAGSYWEKKSVIESNETVTVSISASYKAFHNRRTHIEISNIEFSVVDTYSTNFIVPNSSGILEVNGQTLNQNQSISSPSNKPYTLKFTPSDGYIFVGWYVDGVQVSNNNPFVFYASKNDENVMPIAVDNSAALFSVADSIFVDLEQAINKAINGSDKIVRLHKSGSLSPKADGSSYVFSNGVNLFIPGSGTSNYTDFAVAMPPTTKDVSSQTCNYHLNVQTGVVLNFTTGSAICIAGSMFSGPGSQIGGRPTGEVGELILQSGSSIGLNSTATLYAWGYVSGDGDIYARNGSTVYEGFAFSFRGGDGTLGATGKGVFAFNQYYIQNIECKLHIYYGAIEKTSTSVYMLSSRFNSTFTFIGDGGMFVLQEGCIVEKQYDPKTDRLRMCVNGNGSLSHIGVKLTSIDLLIPVTRNVDSADFILPITNNMDIDVLAGNVSIEQNLEFLPGSTMTVRNGARLTIGSSRDLYFYDLSNWVGKQYSFVSDNVRISYVSPHATEDFKKSSRPLNEGAKLILDGEIQCSGGVYMTKPSDGSAVSAKGKIVSNGGGKFVYLSADYVSGRDTTKTTKQYQNNSTPVDIATTTAVFVNSDSTEFSGTCPAGAALVYENGFWEVQYQGPYEITITFKGVDETTVIGTKKYTIDGNGIELPNQTEFTGFQGSIFLWLDKGDKSRSYEPKTNIKSIRSSITLIAFTGGWYTDLNKDTFYYDRTLGKIKGLRYIDEEGAWPENLYCFDENGHLLTGTGVFFTYTQGTKYDGGGDDNTYYVDNGVVQRKGFATLAVPVGYDVETYYYYFGPSHYAYRNTTCYINTNLNNLLPEGTYTFGNDGRVEVLECSNFADVDSVILSADGYCTFRTIKAGIGLFTSGTHIYYAKDDGSIMKGGTYYVEEGKRNGKVTNAGLYYFDTNGYLCDSLMNPITVTPPEANA